MRWLRPAARLELHAPAVCGIVHDMPLFDFACEACKHRWEDMHRTGEPLPVCPACGASTTEKVLSIGTAYVFPVLEPGRTYDLPKPRKERKRTYNF